ncbi:tagatose 6-phosphate kinase [Paenibacillus shirakamiensis]|uniref:Tagatose-6-phosphate kinase n=1 Tax=Paenibacillus shirakamiensis TaxID=1265935 RepID=A0ABS4JEM5_9BACL|nr:1-phosphofructokinase family hexose kinase [Paenibacillus shirakamiensis]MBP2000152.1 tagatose 6-phosphate kinase [Paenibacillus shirakamiensis]
MTSQAAKNIPSLHQTSVVTVTLNAAIDKTYYLEGWSDGEVMRVKDFLAMAGGKGINVARVLSQLGHRQVTATGFVAGFNGQFIVQDVQKSGIQSEFVEISGESRLCLNFMNQNDHTSTEIIEAGPEVQLAYENRMKDKIRHLARRDQLLIFSGSIPKGCRPELYLELIDIAKQAGAEVFLDASGQPLLEGMKAGPHFIKPNEDEIRPWLNANEFESEVPLDASTHSEESLKKVYGQVLRQLSVTYSIPQVIVTLGSRGAIAQIHDTQYRILTPAVNVLNPVGSGDAFVAGYAYAYTQQLPVEQCLRYATACGSANAMNPAAGFISMDDVRAVLKDIVIESWGNNPNMDK